MSSLKKNTNFNLRMTEDHMRLISNAAKICGKSVAAFMTEASVFSAQRELMDQRFIGVQSDLFDRIDEKLLRPGKAHERLVKLFNHKVEWSD